MKQKQWTREYHEQFAVEAMESARRELPSTHNCDDRSVYATIRANKDIARARVHLSSIGPQDGKRTRHLWGALAKVERQVEQASNRAARCALKD